MDGKPNLVKILRKDCYCCSCQFTCMCLESDHDLFNTVDAQTHHSNEQPMLMWLDVLPSMLKCLPALLLLDCEDVKQLC